VYPLSTRRAVPESIQHPDYAKDGIPRSEQKFVGRHNITILNKEEQKGMRKVCRLAREVLDIAAGEIKPGVTTDYIDEVVHKACLERDVCFLPCLTWSKLMLITSVIPLPSQLRTFPEIRLHIRE
jgi:methionyl aminopeptidase